MFAFNMKNTLISNMITKRIICTGMMLVVTLGLQADPTSSPSNVNTKVSDELDLDRVKAEQGDGDAQFNLAGAYHFGKVVPKDDVEAASWLRKAAEQGHANAQFTLGNCYRKGEGVPKDEVEAVKWYRKSAEQGVVMAQLNLALCYQNGTGVEKDEVEAAKWLRKAAQQGYAEAQRELGRCYIDGIGVEKNEAEGLQWISKAKEQEKPISAAIGTITTNIQGSNDLLKATINLTSADPDIEQIINENLVALRDAAITIMSSHKFDGRDPASLSKGRESIRQLLKSWFNRLLGGEVIDQVYFSEFVVQ